jgi:hypothetical protein
MILYALAIGVAVVTVFWLGYTAGGLTPERALRDERVRHQATRDQLFAARSHLYEFQMMPMRGRR